MSSILPDAKREAIAAVVSQTVRETSVYDIHTHLYDPAFGELVMQIVLTLAKSMQRVM